MLYGTCTAGELLDGVLADLRLYTPPDRAALRTALNECLCRLYGEILRDTRRLSATASEGRVLLSALTVPSGCRAVGECEVVGAWSGERELHYLPPNLLALGGRGFYTLADGALLLGESEEGEALTLECILRPLPFTEESEGETIPFPDEFLSLLRDRLRGEGCRLAGEDSAAAKWLGAYNTTLNEFRQWYAACTAERRG